MKNFFLAICVLSALASCSNKEPHAINKTWKVVDIQMEGYDSAMLQQVVLAGVYYEFDEDLTYKAIINGDEREGTYVFDESEMKITTNDSNGESEESIISELSAERMIWKKGPNVMIFEPFEESKSQE